MPLATVDDVKRWLKEPAATDEELTLWLEAAIEWVKRTCGRDWDAEDSITETFYQVRQDAALRLKDENPTAVIVKAYSTPDDLGVTLGANTSYAVEDGGRLRLLYARFVTPAGYEEAVVMVPPGELARVEVTYTASGNVPTPVREAVACIAAANYARSARIVSGLQGESIGDYSYTGGYSSGGSGAIAIPPIARAYLAPYRVRRVRST